jgi:hypothetical protein
MCFFLTIGVAGDSADSAELAVPRGFALSQVENKSILSKLPKNYRTFVLTSGMCSCDLYRRRTQRSEDPTEFLRRKYRKKGWSEARVDRAIDQASTHAAARGKTQFVGLRPDAAEIVANFAHVAGRVVLIVHFYGGDVEQETISVGDSRSVSSHEFVASPFPFDEDELIWVIDSERCCHA